MYRADTWTGVDLSHINLKHNFIPETVNLLYQGNRLIDNGIFNRTDDDLLYSAIVDMLITTRNLGEKYRIITNQHRQLYDKIRQFRNAVCHTDSEFNTDGRLVFQISHVPVLSTSGLPNIGKNADGSLDLSKVHDADEILLTMGRKRLLIHQELLAEFEFLQDFFWSNLPSEHEFFKDIQRRKSHQSNDKSP